MSNSNKLSLVVVVGLVLAVSSSALAQSGLIRRNGLCIEAYTTLCGKLSIRETSIRYLPWAQRSNEQKRLHQSRSEEVGRSFESLKAEFVGVIDALNVSTAEKQSLKDRVAEMTFDSDICHENGSEVEVYPPLRALYKPADNKVGLCQSFTLDETYSSYQARLHLARAMAESLDSCSFASTGNNSSLGLSEFSEAYPLSKSVECLEGKLGVRLNDGKMGKALSFLYASTRSATHSHVRACSYDVGRDINSLISEEVAAEVISRYVSKSANLSEERRATEIQLHLLSKCHGDVQAKQKGIFEKVWLTNARVREHFSCSNEIESNVCLPFEASSAEGNSSGGERD